MNALVPITLFGWIPIILIIFALVPPRRAVLVAFLAAWLFLPIAEYRVPGLTSYGKMTATSLGALLGVLLFDARRLFSFRLGWFDLPALVFCLCPMASSIANNMGPYDGTALCIGQIVTWGIPYLIGRLYFFDLEGLKELAIGIFIGGLVYVPLCLYEIRMSPQLHTMVYGYFQHSFGQTIRFGGWRPTVFMEHGLAVGMWMTNSALVGFWLWWSGTLKKLWGIDVRWLLLTLAITAVLCKSVGALALLALGWVTMVAAQRLRMAWLMGILLVVAPAYMTLRATGVWDGRNMVDIAGTVANAERAGSLNTRLIQENQITRFALQKPAFGWGAWGYVESTGADQLWLLIMRNQGLVGLVGMTLMLLLPAAIAFRKFPATAWATPEVGPAVILGLVVLLWLLDCLFNGMVNPLWIVSAGGVSSLAGAGRIVQPLPWRGQLPKPLLKRYKVV